MNLKAANLSEEDRRVFLGKNPWTLSQARELLGDLEEALKPLGFCVGLTGSVLIRGFSENDIDLIVYPRQSVLETEWMKAREGLAVRLRCIFDEVETKRRRLLAGKPGYDNKAVEVWCVRTPGELHNKRVDVFFLK